MIVYVNERDEIHDVGTTENPDLIPLEILDGTFDGWSDAKICCYRVQADENGHVIMLTPYIDSRLIDFVDSMGRKSDEMKQDISDNREGIIETFEIAENNSSDLADVREAIIEIYEMLS